MQPNDFIKALQQSRNNTIARLKQAKDGDLSESPYDIALKGHVEIYLLYRWAEKCLNRSDKKCVQNEILYKGGRREDFYLKPNESHDYYQRIDDAFIEAVEQNAVKLVRQY